MFSYFANKVWFHGNSWKKINSCKTKAKILCTRVRRACLWCPIIKVKEIIIEIHVCPIWWTYLDSKENSGMKLFLGNQSTNIVYPNDENVFIVMNNKRKGFKNACCLISNMTLDLKEIGGEKKAFLAKQKHQYLAS